MNADPAMAPMVAPTPMNLTRRLTSSELKMSTISAQNIETTNKLKTETQMKRARPTHTVCAALARWSDRANSTMMAAKQQYVMGMKRVRGRRLTSSPNG